MHEPLTQEEKAILAEDGWVFTREDYMYIPDDYDGCMAEGIGNIRRILERTIQRKQS